MTSTLAIVGPAYVRTESTVKGKVKAWTSRKTLEVARRWDANLPVAIAREFVDGQVILDALSRQRGGPVDVYFIVSDREKGYRAGVPAIRKILAESSLALDFHYMEPGEAQYED